MNHRHRKVLQAIFAHPVSGNIQFRDVEHVLAALGAEIVNRTGGRIGVTLNGQTAAFRHVGHSLPLEEVQQVRKFLESCGITPANFPA